MQPPLVLGQLLCNPCAPNRNPRRKSHNEQMELYYCCTPAAAIKRQMPLSVLRLSRQLMMMHSIVRRNKVFVRVRCINSERAGA